MKLNKKMIILIVLAMISFAMHDNVRGVFVPTFKQTFNLTSTGIGLMLLVSSLAYTLGSYLAGHLINQFNQQKVMMLGAGFSALGVLALVVTPYSWGFFGGMILSNLGIALSGLAINTTIPQLSVKNPAVLMNAVHFLYGFGATITQKSAGALLAVGWTFRAIYLAIMGLYLVVVVLAALTPLPEESVEDKIKIKFNKGQTLVIWVLSLGLGLYVSAEIQTANWLVAYGSEAFKMHENDIATYAAAFFMIFSFGRLVGGFVADRFGYLKSVTMSVLVAGTLYTLGLMLDEWGLWLIALSGIFFSITYPTVILALKDYFKKTVTQAAGLVVTLSSAVNMVIGLLIGYLADHVGIQVAMYSIPASLFICSLLIGLVYVKGHDVIEKYTHS